MDLILPYKVGDLAEYKCFVPGFRGSWFRCKIHNMRVNDFGYLECYLKYIDYDETKDMEWVSVFQKNPASSNKNSRESTEIMIRPSFPQWYYGHEVLEQFPVSDVTAIVDETWKVGDLVDWLNEGCYWSGKITKIINKDMVKLELPAPPIGEGKCYAANRKDLRPTLEWSLSKGWRVPLAQAKGKSWNAARLIQHCKSESDKSTSDDENGNDENRDVHQLVPRASNMPHEAPGPVIPASPSATNSVSIQSPQMHATVTSMDNLNPMSISTSPYPSHGAQAAANTSQPAGTGIRRGRLADGAERLHRLVSERMGALREMLDSMEANLNARSTSVSPADPIHGAQAAATATGSQPEPVVTGISMEQEQDASLTEGDRFDFEAGVEELYRMVSDDTSDLMEMLNSMEARLNRSSAAHSPADPIHGSQAAATATSSQPVVTGIPMEDTALAEGDQFDFDAEAEELHRMVSDDTSELMETLNSMEARPNPSSAPQSPADRIHGAQAATSGQPVVTGISMEDTTLTEVDQFDLTEGDQFDFDAEAEELHRMVSDAMGELMEHLNPLEEDVRSSRAELLGMLDSIEAELKSIEEQAESNERLYDELQARLDALSSSSNAPPPRE